MKVEMESLPETNKPELESKHPPRALVPVSIGLALLLVGLFISGILPRLGRNQEIARAQSEHAGTPAFRTQKAVPAEAVVEVTLPASIEPVQDIPIYARTDGYLKERLVDIGDRVKRGQLLAVIETPEVDQQLKQGESDLAQSLASLESSKADLKQGQANIATALATVKRIKAGLAFSIAEVARYRQLAADGAVSNEQRDSKIRDVESDEASLNASISDVEASKSRVTALEQKVKQAEASVESARANIKRLSSLAGFQNVYAPADGVITARNVDSGALITHGSDGNNKELLRMARTDVLRVFVSVPQTYFNAMKVGLPAEIKISELPKQTFPGTVAHVAGGLDAASRTLRTEVRIPNGKNALMPGMYAQVAFKIKRDEPPLTLPSNAIIVRKDGQFVCIVAKGNKVHYEKVELGRDHGADVEVVSGVPQGAKVVLDPPDWLSDGTTIKPAEETPDASNQLSGSKVEHK